jgi:hypothetical protein
MIRFRPFTGPEERALIKLGAAPGTAQVDITRDRPSTYARLADQGLAAVTTIRRQKRARLTATGRYFAQLLAAREERS